MQDDLPAALDLYKQMETARFTNASFGFNIILEAYLTYKGHQVRLLLRFIAYPCSLYAFSRPC